MVYFAFTIYLLYCYTKLIKKIIFFFLGNLKMINHRIPLKILPTVVVAIVLLVEGLCLPAHSKNIILEGK